MPIDDWDRVTNRLTGRPMSADPAVKPTGDTRQWRGEIPPHVQEYIDWLVDPQNIPHDKKKWAGEHGVHRKTVYDWHKRKDFNEALDARARELNLSPDRIQNVLNAVYNAAVQGDTKAATLYLQHVDRLAPRRVVVEDRRIADMSDAELQEQLERAGLVASSGD